MTKEQILKKYYEKYTSESKKSWGQWGEQLEESLQISFSAMDEWAAIQNKVLIDALQKIQDKIRIWEQDNGASNLSVSIKEIAAPALASYAAPPEKQEDAVVAFQKRFVVGHIPEYMQESFRFFSEGFKAAGGCQVTGKSAGKEQLTNLRNRFYDQMPKGEVKVWDMIEWATEMFKEFDAFIDDRDESGEAGKQPEQQPADERPSPSDAFKHCNHHHKLTADHQLVDFGDGEFVANKAAIHLLKALNEAGLRTRSHHMDKPGQGFICILMDNVDIEVRVVNERDATRTKYNGKKEICIQWGGPHKGEAAITGEQKGALQ